MSLSIQYDLSFDGFLSVVFEIYRQHLDVGEIVPMRPYGGEEVLATNLFCQAFHIETCEESARRLKRAIVNAAGEDVLGVIDAAFRSEEPGVEMKILAYLRKLFAGLEPNYAKNPTSDEMLPLYKIAKAVRAEQGAMLGLVRFDKTPDGTYISEIEPKYDVVELLAGHFRGRFPNGKWAIIDIKRGYGVYYSERQTQLVSVPDPATLSKIAKPDEITRMWKSYYDTMAIKERLNPECLKRCLPVRYWKHLPERQTDVSDLVIGGKKSEKRGGEGLGSQNLPSAIAQSQSLRLYGVSAALGR